MCRTVCCRLNPLSYMLYGIITSQLGDVTSTITVAPGETSTVQELLRSEWQDSAARSFPSSVHSSVQVPVASALGSCTVACSVGIVIHVIDPPHCLCLFCRAVVSVPAAAMLGFQASFVGWCALIMAGFILAFVAAIIGALRFFNFQRR